jgi:hypothetical protein
MRLSSSQYTVDLREEIVDKTLRKVFEKQSNQPRQWVIHTNIVGYIQWEIAMIKHIHSEIPNV